MAMELFDSKENKGLHFESFFLFGKLSVEQLQSGCLCTTGRQTLITKMGKHRQQCNLLSTLTSHDSFCCNEKCNRIHR